MGTWKAARTTAFVCYSSGTSGLPVCQLSYILALSKTGGREVRIVRARADKHLERCYDITP